MLKKVLTFILAGGVGSRLAPLTYERAKPAVPFGGKYRIIDFTLSNCINSGLKKIFVLTQYKSLSLNAHLRRAWLILSPEIDEFIVPIPPQMRINKEWYQGTADAIYQNLNLFGDSIVKPEHILILSGDHVYKMDYKKMLEFHIENNADLTISAVEVSKDEAKGLGIMEISPKYRVVGFEEKPDNPKEIPGQKGKCLASMGIYIFSAKVLEEILIDDANNKDSSHDFGKDIIPSMINSFRVFCYPFNKNRIAGDSDYWRDVGTIKAYFESNLDLAFVEPKFNLYEEEWPIRTYNIQSPPAKFVFANVREERVGQALDSIICDGVIVSGGRVEDSVLSPKVRINSFSYVKKCILFENVNVGRKSRLKNTIVDKNVRIPEGEEIGYDLEKDRKRFTVTEEGIVVIPKNYRFKML
jgi:glucose-1-phosphate adenylyltransferase